MTDKPYTASDEEPLNEILDGLADVRDAWWQEWDDANMQPNGRSGLGYDIEQGWDAAWACIEQQLPALLRAHDAQIAGRALREAAEWQNFPIEDMTASEVRLHAEKWLLDRATRIEGES